MLTYPFSRMQIISITFLILEELNHLHYIKMTLMLRNMIMRR